MRKYRIGGVSFYQDELKFQDNELVRDVLRDANINVHDTVSLEIGKLLDSLYDKKVLQKIIPVILKPYEPNAFYRWRNARGYKKNNFTQETAVQIMTDSEIARVMIDFFIYKSLWIQNLTSLNGLLNSSKAIRWMMNPFTSLKKFFSYQGKTSPVQAK